MQYDENNYQEAVLVLPRLRVQNANAISSPMTWGFPSITAFIGLMHALARHLQPASGLEFRGVGVICHDFEAQVTEGGYTHAFRQTRHRWTSMAARRPSSKKDAFIWTSLWCFW